MPRTLLVGSQTGAYREWLKEHRSSRDLLCLDPADPDSGPPGRIALYREEKCQAWGFIGSLSALRAPQMLLAALERLLPELSEDAIIELFPYRPSPLRLQLARLCAQILRPEAILVDRRAQLEKAGWPVPVEEIELPDGPPASVQSGHRKARWLQMIDDCEPHEIDLLHVGIDGLRLGSGVPIPIENLRKYGFADPLHAEVAGSSLLVISEGPVSDVEVSRALDSTHTSKAHIVTPRHYENLLCSFARENGEDFGMGHIVQIRFPERVAIVHCTAVPETPVALLRVGSLRVDAEGRELGELKPWEA